VSIYLDEFETLYGISDNIEKLRNKILELAFKGELVSKKEKHAKPELDKIITKKNKMIKNKIIRKPYGGIKDIKDSDKPHKIPKYWEWVRLGQIMNFQNGYAFKSSEFISKGVGIVKIGNISNGQISEIGMNFISKEKEVDKKYYVEKNDMLIAMSGATTGKLGINKNEKTYYLNQRVGKITPIETNQKYMYYYLKTLMAENLEKSSGSAIPNLSTKQINNLMFPFAPLEEQKRIVDKIEKLMKEVDKLGIKLEEKEDVSQDLSYSIVEAIKSSRYADELKENLKFIIDNFNVIFKTSESMNEMRNVVLQLAIEGKLVSQYENDEPASELIKKIEKEKRKLIREGKIKNSKKEKIKEEEKPFKIPDNWEWVKLNDIKYNKFTGLVRNSKEQGDNLDYPYFKMNNINNHLGYNYKDITYIKANKDELEKYSLEEGDFLFNTRNSIKLVGKTCVLTSIPYDKLLFNNNILKIEFSEKYIYNKYISLWFNSPAGKNLLNEYKSNTTNVCAIYQNKLFSLVVPIPPLKEQKRIVKKVDSIMGIIDKLEKELIKKEELVEKLGAI
jgi:type I restriction enzyme S subunit